MEVSMDTAFENQDIFMKVRKIWSAGLVEQVMSVKSQLPSTCFTRALLPGMYLWLLALHA